MATSNKSRKPFNPAGAGTPRAKSTDASAIAKMLELSDGSVKVPSELLSKEAQEKINQLGKDVDPDKYFAVNKSEPSVIEPPLVAPWAGKSARKKVKAFNLFPSEAIKARLEYLSRKTGVSQHEICIDYLEQRIINETDELFEKERRDRS